MNFASKNNLHEPSFMLIRKSHVTYHTYVILSGFNTSRFIVMVLLAWQLFILYNQMSSIEEIQINL